MVSHGEQDVGDPEFLSSWNETHHCLCFCKGTRYLWVFLTSHYPGSALESPWAGVCEFSGW